MYILVSLVVFVFLKLQNMDPRPPNEINLMLPGLENVKNKESETTLSSNIIGKYVDLSGKGVFFQILSFSNSTILAATHTRIAFSTLHIPALIEGESPRIGKGLNPGCAKHQQTKNKTNHELPMVIVDSTPDAKTRVVDNGNPSHQCFLVVSPTEPTM